MELWIRTQNKTTLLKVEEINLFNLGSFYRLETPTCVLGNYKTQKRALEILDEIQKILRPKGIIKFDGFLDVESQKKVNKMLDDKYLIFNKNVELLQQVETYVYEMPKE